MYPRWSLLPPPTDSQRVLWSSRKQHARETHSQTPVGCDSTHENRPFWTDALSSNATLFQLPGRGGGALAYFTSARHVLPPHHTHTPTHLQLVVSSAQGGERARGRERSFRLQVARWRTATEDTGARAALRSVSAAYSATLIVSSSLPDILIHLGNTNTLEGKREKLLFLSFLRQNTLNEWSKSTFFFLGVLCTT